MEQGILGEKKELGKNTNPKKEYFKLIAIMMRIFIVVPALGFIVLFPLTMPLLARAPILFSLIPLGILAYMGIAVYWFFKKGMYQKMIGASMQYGLQRSKEIMKNLPEKTKNEMMQNSMVKQFKEEIKQEMQQENQGQRKENERTNY